jgi:surface protein
MSVMFSGATKFNSNISGWNVKDVTNMEQMFENAVNFNSDLSKWDVRNVTDMYRMFYGAKKINQDLCNWKLQNCPTLPDVQQMFLKTSCPSKVDPNCSESSTFCKPCV